MKATLRKQLRVQRRSLSAADHAHRSQIAVSAITRMAAFKCGARVAIYLPFDGETDTRTLIDAARRRGVRLFVPVVSDRRHRRLRFYPLTGETRRGLYGILVPRRRGPATAPRWFDLLVIPLVGIDRHGRRLGMGGGFYDRALRFRHDRHAWQGPRLVGLAFDCQHIDAGFADPWDVTLDSVATESGLRHFSKGNQ